jgi:hypothetical protein
MKLTESRPYDALRTFVENEGGAMTFERAGQPPGGTWIVHLEGRETPFFSNGAGFPELDGLYVPRAPNPTHWRDYSCELIPNAREVFLKLLKGG